MSTRRSTSLSDRLAKMAATEPEPDESAPVEPTARPLKVAPVPADSSDDEPDRTEPTGSEAAEATGTPPDDAPAPDDAQGPDGGEGPVQTAKVLASTAALTADPQPEPEDEPESVPPVVDQPVEPAPEEKPAAPRRKAATTTPATTETAAPAPAVGLDLHHLRETMERGRNQRRWVEDNLPHRSERGTFMRLPVHLLDVLDEYCDRKDLPQQDFVAAVLDSYFRDLGALPPLGAGHHPDERFFTEMRRQARSRDY